MVGSKFQKKALTENMHTLDGPIAYIPEINATPTEPEAPASSGTGGTETPASSGTDGTKTPGEYLSYVDVLNGEVNAQKEAAKESYATYEQFLTEQRDNAIANAETERKRGVIDAQASYDFNKATYGANAEALRSMGLTGSGYADFLTTKAYATQRAEVQGANAQAAAAKKEAENSYSQNLLLAKSALDDKLLGIDTTYKTNMLEAERQAASDYNAILTGLKSGTYTKEQALQMGKDMKLTGEQLASIGSTSNEYTEGIQDQTYLYYKSLIGTSDFDGAAVERAYKNGSLSPTDYESLKNMVNDYTDTNSALNFKDANDKYISVSEAEKAVLDVENNPLISEEVKVKFREEFNKTYRWVGQANVHHSGGKNNGKEGKKFQVQVGNGKEYSVKYGKEITSDNRLYNAISSAAYYVSDWHVFKYGDTLYIKQPGGKYYEVEGASDVLKKRFPKK